MALILAVDPGGSQALAIERLAQELREHEVVSAESSAEALAAVERRVPDLVLLPALLPDAEEAELRSRMRAAAGDVLTLTLPLLASGDAAPVGRRSRWFSRFSAGGARSSTEACDPRVFAAQIREYLVGWSGTPPREEPGPETRGVPNAMPPERRAQVLAAATAAAAWVHARRATRPDTTTAQDSEAAPVPAHASPRQDRTQEPARIGRPSAAPRAPEIPLPPPVVAESPPQLWDRAQVSPQEDWEPAPLAAAPHSSSVPSLGDETGLGVEPIGAWTTSATPARHSEGSRLATTVLALRVPGSRWLPRVVTLAVLVALAAAGRACWPALRAELTNGTVMLESVPSGSQVFIDGRAAGATPLTIELPAGSHTVEFRDGASSQTREVVVVARGRVVERMDWTMKPTGSLQVDSDPSGARVVVDGQVRGTTPLKLDGLAVGTHLLVLESAAGAVRRPVTIAAGETAQVTELIFSGWLAVFSPFEVELSEGNRALPLDERGRVMLAPGSHDLRFQNRALGYDEIRRVEIKPSATAALTLAPPPTTIGVTATEPADVWIDGADVGQTPIVDASVSLGTREIVVRTAAGDERRFVVTATSKPLRLDVDFSKPQP